MVKEFKEILERKEARLKELWDCVQREGNRQADEQDRAMRAQKRAALLQDL